LHKEPIMESPLVDLTPSSLTHAVEANLRGMFSAYRHWPDALVHFGPPLCWSVSRVPHPLFNCALGARLGRDEAPAAIVAACDRCRDFGVPMFWWTSSVDTPSGLPARLRACGFSPLGNAPGMAADLQTACPDAPTPAGLAIAEVRIDSALREWNRVFAEGFALPDFARDAFLELFRSARQADPDGVFHFTASLDGRTVAAASLVPAAGVAGIYNVATLEAFRGRGIGTALTRELMRLAREMGFRAAVLIATPQGYSVFHKLGFRDVCEIGQYLWTPGE
jgi:GNAT superfamily N-acetyltransferase